LILFFTRPLTGALPRTISRWLGTFTAFVVMALAVSCGALGERLTLTVA